MWGHQHLQCRAVLRRIHKKESPPLHTPRESRVPSLEKLFVPWKVTVVLEAIPGHTGNLRGEPDRNHTISLVCFHLGTLLEAHMGSTQALSGARPGLGGAGGQGSGLVPPPPWRQAAGSWLCPSSWGGRPASPGLTLRQLLLLLSRPGHLCAPGECVSQPQSTPERISPQMLIPLVPILSSGSRSSGTPEL